MIQTIILLPISFQRIDTNLTIGFGHIRMEDLGEEESLWWGRWEIATDNQLDSEYSSFEWRAFWAMDGRLNIPTIIKVGTEWLLAQQCQTYMMLSSFNKTLIPAGG